MHQLQRNTVFHVSVWLTAAIVGAIAVLYARLISWAQSEYFAGFTAHPHLVAALTPVAFVVSAGIVQKLGIEARGSGIPQVLEAIELSSHPDHKHEIWAHRLVSIPTAVVKVLSSTLGTLGGASIGREGPTIQIAASAFSAVGNQLRRIFPGINFQIFITAGAAAGVAAAFNTPLAGVTFALEEVVEGGFGTFKRLAILAVILSGITAQALGGNYLYFGHLRIENPDVLKYLLEAVPVGLLAGLAGGIFARLLSRPSALRLPGAWWSRALFCGVICSLLGLLTNGDTAGSGYEVTRRALESAGEVHPGLLFPLFKMATTVLSYLSGMAGGIFAPALSIGAGIGLTFASFVQAAGPRVCALLGMVGFFSGAVQAPLTGVVIVMEMTDQHALILPFMASALIGQGIGRILMPVPLYQYLAAKHRTG